MATPINTNRTELQAGNPLDNWVWTQQQFSLYFISSSGTINTQTKANNFGYSVMDALQPIWACFPSNFVGYGYVLLEGGQSAASVKATLDDQAYHTTPGAETFTVTAATGAWNDGNDLIWNTDRYFKWYDPTYSYFDTNSEFHDSTNVLSMRESYNSSDSDDYSNHPKLQEWLELISAGQNWNGGNWRDGTGREANFPYDLPLTNSNIALVGIDHDEYDQDDVGDINNAYYDIDGVFERMINAAQPLGYVVEYEDETDIGSTESIAMFVDLSIFDPLSFRRQINHSADDSADVHLYCTTLDFTSSTGTDTD